MNKRVNVMDASAVLAYLKAEKGHEVVEAALDEGRSELTAVNYCEVLGKTAGVGMPAEQAEVMIHDLGVSVVDFDMDLARRAAGLLGMTSGIGASLGDRACLARAGRLAEERFKPVVFTADRLWGKLMWPFEVVLIRA